jgi:polysaccharide export outer membrane protein
VSLLSIKSLLRLDVKVVTEVMRRILTARWVILPIVVVLSGCSTFPAWLPSSGPRVAQVIEQENIESPIPVVEVSEAVARRVQDAKRKDTFAEEYPSPPPRTSLVGAGDVLAISLWEAPPAALFGVALADPSAGLTSTRQTNFPQQMVNDDGMINIPFAGEILVSGKNLRQIEAEISRRLSKKANQPQVMVSIIRNMTSIVTVIGEVAQNTRMALTPKRERLLDAVAAAGGVRHPVGKINLQLSRGGKVTTMPLNSVVRDPSQNIYLEPGDIVTALFQSLSFTALGATGKNEEVNFEAQGITLAQALGRMAGVRDDRADARGLFIFRFEEPQAALAVAEAATSGAMIVTPDGKVPLVYRLDLGDPLSFLAAQQFPMRDKDVVYVANAPSADLQKFLNILTASFFSINSLVNLGQ